MSQQFGQWESWQREGQQPVERQPERSGPVKADHFLNPQKSDLSSTKQQPQPHGNDDKKSDNDEHVPDEPQQESGVDETEGASGAWIVVDRSTEQELTATIRQLEEELKEKNKAIQNEKEESGKLKERNSFLDKRLKEKDKELEAIKQQLERELAEAKDSEVKHVEKRFEMTKNGELKKQLKKLEEEKKYKLEQLQQKVIKIKHLEEQLSEKEKYIFDMEASIAADQNERERLNKEKEEKEKESDKNITDATQRINELEQKNQEQLKELKEKNEQLRITVLEQEKLTRELNEKDTELEEWRTRITKEAECIRKAEGKMQVELANLNTQRRELEEKKQKMDDLTSELKEKAKAKYSDRLKEWQAKFNEVDSENKKLKDELDETEAKRLSLENDLQELNEQFLKLKKQLQDKEQHCTILKDSLAVKCKIAIDLEKQVEELMKQSTKREQELLESLNLKETENTIIKEDFISERSDRERTHAQLNDLQGKCGLLKQELEEKEQKLVKAQMMFHNFQQSHSTVERDLEVSQKRITTLLKKETELSETIKSLTEEKKKMDKQLKEMKAMETDRMKVQEEEIQVLTAQVNAYSRECEKQKGLVAQNQETHKTEIQELNEKLANEQQQLESQLTAMKKQYDSVSACKESLQKSNQKLANEWTMLREQFDNLTATNNSLCATNERLQQSKQQLESQLNTMKKHLDSVSASKENLQQSNQQLANDLTILRQQFDSLTASKESLLTAYDQEQAMVTSLQQQLQRMREESATMKKANKVLKDKVLILQQQPSSQTAKPVVTSHPNMPSKFGTRKNTTNSAPPTGSKHPIPVQSDGNAEMVFVSQQVAPPPHAEQPDSVPDDTPLMSKEEMSRLFKWQNQQDDSGQATVTQRPQQVEDSLVKEQRRQELAQKADEAVLEVERMRKQPLPRTTLPHASSKQEPVNQRQPKKKVKQQQAAADDSDSDIEENILLKGIDDEIHEMAEEVRRMSRRPVTDEIILDNEDSSLPYDPNLVCPKCGRQYRVGEIQKLKRHINEFCTGKR